MVENSPSVVYNDYCKILRTNRGFDQLVMHEHAKTVISPWETDKVLLDLKMK